MNPYRHSHLVVAHRLGGTEAPENTFAALKHAIDSQYRAVEFDVKLTKDKKTVLFHDETFGRTVQQPGKVGDYELSTLLSFDAGSWHPNQSFNKEPITQFGTVLDCCKHNSIWMNVEIKPELHTDVETGRIVGEQLQKAFAEDISSYLNARDSGNMALARELIHKLPLLSSFSFTALMSAKLAAPDLPRAFLIKDISNTTDWREKLQELQAVAVHTNVRTLTQQDAKEIKARGYALMCYTVNTEEDHKRLLSYGVDSICTDKLEMFQYLTTLDDFAGIPVSPVPVGRSLNTELSLPSEDTAAVSTVFGYQAGNSKSTPQDLFSLSAQDMTATGTELLTPSTPYGMRVRSVSTPILAPVG